MILHFPYAAFCSLDVAEAKVGNLVPETRCRVELPCAILAYVLACPTAFPDSRLPHPCEPPILSVL